MFIPLKEGLLHGIYGERHILGINVSCFGRPVVVLMCRLLSVPPLDRVQDGRVKHW